MGQPNRREFIASAVAGASALVAGCGGAHLRPARATTASARPRRVARPLPPTLEAAIRGPVIRRGSPSFQAAAHIYNERFDSVVPSVIARPLDVSDVSSAVRWCSGEGLPLRIRSGGHSYAGYSTISDGVVLDLRYLRRIQVDARSVRASVGAGAQLIDLYAALARRGVSVPAGSCPSVGVAGHALGGGMGFAGRAFGLLTDNILGARLVTANGRSEVVDGRSNPDLLWALRGGGGGNFGVVTELLLGVHRVPAVASWFSVSWPWSMAASALAAWQEWSRSAPDAVTSQFQLETGQSEPSAKAVGQYLGPSGDLPTLLRGLTAVDGGTVSTGEEGYFQLQVRWADCDSRRACHTVGTRSGGELPRARFWAKSDFVTQPLSARARSVLVSAIEARQGQVGRSAILLDAYGGAINRIAPDASAFVHRDALACIQYLAYGGGDAWLRATHAAMRPYVSGMAYQNYMDPELANWREAYYGTNYRRLVEVQRSVDPEHLFRFPQAIGT